MTFNELVENATKMQAEILDLDKRIREKQKELNGLPIVEELANLEKEKGNKMNLYKGFTKETLGLADNEQTNVLEIAKAIKKIVAYD
jgi:hypothetical protein